MKVSYAEGIASYGGPESYVHTYKGVGETLTGGRAGRVLSRVIHVPQRELRAVRGAEVMETSRRPHCVCRIGEADIDPARLAIPRTRASTFSETRRPHVFLSVLCRAAAERIEKPEGVQR